MPHNQYIFTMVGFGAVGTLIFYFGFYGILFFKPYRNDLIICIQFLIVSISFLFETTLETQLGNNFSLSFLIIPLYFLISNDGREKEIS